MHGSTITSIWTFTANGAEVAPEAGCVFRVSLSSAVLTRSSGPCHIRGTSKLRSGIRGMAGPPSVMVRKTWSRVGRRPPSLFRHLQLPRR